MFLSPPLFPSGFAAVGYFLSEMLETNVWAHQTNLQRKSGLVTDQSRLHPVWGALAGDILLTRISRGRTKELSTS